MTPRNAGTTYPAGTLRVRLQFGRGYDATECKGRTTSERGYGTASIRPRL